MSSKHDFIAIYRLNFYKNQQEWKLTRKGRSVGNGHTCSENENTNHSSNTINSSTTQHKNRVSRIDLNKTYSVDISCISVTESAPAFSSDTVVSERSTPGFSSDLGLSERLMAKDIFNDAFLRSGHGDGDPTGDMSLCSLESEDAFFQNAALAPHSSELNLRSTDANNMEVAHEEPTKDMPDWEENELHQISLMPYEELMRIAKQEQLAVERHSRRRDHLLHICRVLEPTMHNLDQYPALYHLGYTGHVLVNTMNHDTVPPSYPQPDLYVGYKNTYGNLAIINTGQVNDTVCNLNVNYRSATSVPCPVGMSRGRGRTVRDVPVTPGQRGRC